MQSPRHSQSADSKAYTHRLFPQKQISTKLPDGSLHHYTYADLYARVKRLAKALVGLGIQPGDRVGTFGWNNYQHLEMYYAIPGCGAVCHTLNIRLFPEQLAYVINHAEDKVIFIDGTLLPLFERVADQLKGVAHYVLFNAAKEISTRLPNVLFYEDLLAEADDDFAWSVHDETMAMGLCYTSGTTGNPKGVVYSHRSMFLHTLGINQAAALGLTERDIILPVVPQFHAMAWGLPYAGIMVGSAMIMPGPHLNPPALATMIAEEKVTVPAGSAGKKGRLNTPKKKLFLLLYYPKTYPTFDVLGYHFDLVRSKSYINVHRLFPVLRPALDRLQVLPQRQFTSIEELQAAFADITELFIKATERTHCRPQDAQAQQEKFSGKSDNTASKTR